MLGNTPLGFVLRAASQREGTETARVTTEIQPGPLGREVWGVLSILQFLLKGSLCAVCVCVRVHVYACVYVCAACMYMCV